MTEDVRTELERVRRTLADQSVELRELRARERERSGLGLLAVTAAAGADAGSDSHQELLDLIVRTATVALDADAASLFVVDPLTEELIFQVAIGGAGDMLRGQRIPLGTGVVGFVAATGSPLTVNSTRDDARFAASFAKSVGYVPENLLATPLIDDGDVVGVLEVLNKRHGQEGFTPRDIEVLSMFANQSAVALRRSKAGADMMQALTDAAEGEADESSEVAFALRLSRLVQDIIRRGQRERRLLLSIVELIEGYLVAADRPE